MIKIAVCDDDELDREKIKKLCDEYYEKDYEILEFTDGGSLLNILKRTQFSIIFLDIEMKEINGIEVKNYMDLNGIPGYIIFITGYNDFIYDAIGRNVCGYIEKPVDKNVLYCKLDLINMYETMYKQIEVEDIKGEIVNIRTENIVYIHAERVYTNVVMIAGENIIVRRMLKDWEEKMDTNFFFRVQKSYIINLKYVIKINKAVYMKDNTKINISREKIGALREARKKYLRKTARLI